MTEDAAWLEHAIDLATRNVGQGGGPFGAVVVRDGRLLGEGANRVTATLDPTAHAEVVAIRAACRAAGDFQLPGATVYASCEPCPLCLATLLWARVDRLVFAAGRQDAAAVGFDDAAFHAVLPHREELLPFRLEHLAVPGSGRPFAVWSAAADRVEY